MNLEEKITVKNEVDIVTSRLLAKELANQLGFSLIDKHCIATSVSELATNIYFYAGKGTITLRPVERFDGAKGLEVIAQDFGQGIEDIALAMQDGYSTSDGLGGGLPGVSRMMSEMEIFSLVGRGTTVRAIKWLKNDNAIEQAFIFPAALKESVGNY